MRNTLLNLYVKFQGLKNSEEGQDLVEYALLVALIALCASAASKASRRRSTRSSATSAARSNGCRQHNAPG